MKNLVQNAIDEILPVKARKRRVVYNGGMEIDIDGTHRIITPELQKLASEKYGMFADLTKNQWEELEKLVLTDKLLKKNNEEERS